MQKRYADCNQHELNRALVYRGHSAQFVTFYTPSKTADFKPDNYPDCPSDVPAHQFDAWWGGQDREPELF